jgi:hypothetical protein
MQTTSTAFTHLRIASYRIASIHNVNVNVNLSLNQQK